MTNAADSQQRLKQRDSEIVPPIFMREWLAYSEDAADPSIGWRGSVM
jgi:hypothetical protein